MWGSHLQKGILSTTTGITIITSTILLSPYVDDFFVVPDPRLPGNNVLSGFGSLSVLLGIVLIAIGISYLRQYREVSRKEPREWKYLDRLHKGKHTTDA